MKKLMILCSILTTALTAVEPIWAAEDTSTTRASSEEMGPLRLRDMGIRLNPQVGVSRFEYSGNTGGGHQQLTGGLTAEFGEGMRKLETGILLIPTSSDIVLNNGQTSRLNTTYLTVPMMAKIRVISLPAQSWYTKFGAQTAVSIGSSDRNVTNAMDVMLGLGLGGRFAFNKKTDLLIEAMYNRGMLDAVHTSKGPNYNQGFVVMTGLSFGI